MKSSAIVRVWGWPILLAVLTATGLVSALVSQGLWASALSWVGLGLPLILILRYWLLRRMFDRKLRS